jgi:PqqD family protein of HPr-rel-A system
MATEYADRPAAARSRKAGDGARAGAGAGGEDVIHPSGVERSWVPAPCPEVATYPLDDELVLYDPHGARTYLLNSTAADIWALCDGTTAVEAIAQRLATAYMLDHGRALADVQELLVDLRRGGLLAAP